MTFGMCLVGLLSIVSLIFLILTVGFRQKQRSLFDQLNSEGILDVFLTLSIRYLAAAMWPEDSTREEKDQLLEDLKSTARIIRPLHDAERLGNKYTVYSWISVIFLLVAALSVYLGL